MGFQVDAFVYNVRKSIFIGASASDVLHEFRMKMQFIKTVLNVYAGVAVLSNLPGVQVPMDSGIGSAFFLAGIDSMCLMQWPIVAIQRFLSAYDAPPNLQPRSQHPNSYRVLQAIDEYNGPDVGDSNAARAAVVTALLFGTLKGTDKNVWGGVGLLAKHMNKDAVKQLESILTKHRKGTYSNITAMTMVSTLIRMQFSVPEHQAGARHTIYLAMFGYGFASHIYANLCIQMGIGFTRQNWARQSPPTRFRNQTMASVTQHVLDNLIFDPQEMSPKLAKECLFWQAKRCKYYASPIKRAVYTLFISTLARDIRQSAIRQSDIVLGFDYQNGYMLLGPRGGPPTRHVRLQAAAADAIFIGDAFPGGPCSALQGVKLPWLPEEMMFLILSFLPCVAML